MFTGTVQMMQFQKEIRVEVNALADTVIEIAFVKIGIHWNGSALLSDLREGVCYFMKIHKKIINVQRVNQTEQDRFVGKIIVIHWNVDRDHVAIIISDRFAPIQWHVARINPIRNIWLMK